MYDKYGQLYRHWSTEANLLTGDLTWVEEGQRGVMTCSAHQPMACSQAAALALSSGMISQPERLCTEWRMHARIATIQGTLHTAYPHVIPDKMVETAQGIAACTSLLQKLHFGANDHLSKSA